MSSSLLHVASTLIFLCSPDTDEMAPSGKVVWSPGALAVFLSVIDSSGDNVALEFIANWVPLEQKLSPDLCAEFMWMFRENGVEHYKHIVTRRYLRLDQNGRCFAWTGDGLKEVPFGQEWKRVSGRAEGGQDDGDSN